jgi:SAM-dependent methyltransferase
MDQDLMTYDGEELPFVSQSFDVVLSNAVLEHVSDIGALSGEMARVTKDGGICYHLWHNYYSLYGAHVPEDIALSTPWGHLRNDDRVRDWLALSGTYLNETLPDEISRILSRDFDGVALHGLDRNHNISGIDSSYEREGESLLTEEIRDELKTYPEDLLLTRAYAFLGRKKGASNAVV